MNKLKELIKELCPNGVEYTALGKIGELYGGLSGKSKSSSTANVDPLFSLLLTVIVPPIKVTRFLAIDMPKPVPPYF